MSWVFMSWKFYVIQKAKDFMNMVYMKFCHSELDSILWIKLELVLFLGEDIEIRAGFRA